MHKKDESCTIIIVTKKEAPAKKLYFSGNFIITALTILTVLLLCATYFIYDYVSIRRDKAELYALRAITREQREQFDVLSQKVAIVNEKMDELKGLDRKIRDIANLNKIGEEKPTIGVGGPINPDNKLRALLEGNNQALIEEMHRSLDVLSKGAEEQKESFSQLLDFLKKQKSILAATPSIWPVRGWVTSEFGNRYSLFTGRTEFHAGIDIAADVGTPIKAPALGIVTEAGYQPYMGNMIAIEHGYGMKTVYGHLQKILVKTGDQVKRGDTIGTVGTTGRSTGPHLHYGVYVNNVSVNPRSYIR